MISQRKSTTHLRWKMLNNNKSKNNLSPIQLLNNWQSQNKRVIIYANTGAKLPGKVISFDNYNLVILGEDNKTHLVFKANIFFIEEASK